VQALFETHGIDEGCPLPGWARLLREVLRAKSHKAVSERQTANWQIQDGSRHCVLQLEPHLELYPFEELWADFVSLFSRRLVGRLRGPSANLLSTLAQRDLEHGLIGELSSIALRTTYARFQTYRSQALGRFAEFASSRSTSIYDQYISKELNNGLVRLFDDYPVLGRRLANRTALWTEAQIEMVNRLARDLPMLITVFFGGVRPGRLNRVQSRASDFHCRGRATAILTFESGDKIVYKPKSVGMEKAFNTFVKALNLRQAPVDFPVLTVLDKYSYGWVEYVEFKPCADEAAAKRYYRRVGALLSVLYLLHASDYHLGNVIASGEYPIPIDHECLLSPGAQLLLQRGDELLQEYQWAQHSVCTIGILPYRSDNSTPDLSVLGDHCKIASFARAHCTDVNTDGMKLTAQRDISLHHESVLHSSSGLICAHHYVTEIVTGFTATYRFLIDCRKRIGDANELLRFFRGQKARLINRRSSYYVEILERASTPVNQRAGFQFSREIERLARMYVDWVIILPDIQKLMAIEREALMREDIPLFHFLTDSTDLSADGHRIIPGFLKRNSYEDTVDRFLNLSEDDLLRQTRLIRRSFGEVARHACTHSAAGPSD
jgi:type 2 lantibiotic biosynthesis protein LanM